MGKHCMVEQDYDENCKKEKCIFKELCRRLKDEEKHYKTSKE